MYGSVYTLSIMVHQLPVIPTECSRVEESLNFNYLWSLKFKGSPSTALRASPNSHSSDALSRSGWYAKFCSCMKNHQYFVYIMASMSGTLYIGVTNDLCKRVWQHKNDILEGFTKKYQCHKLIYFEETSDVESAIAREKQLKKWNRAKKQWLIKQSNPTWKDLSLDWNS